MPDFLKKILKMFTDDERMQRRGFFSTFFKTTEEDYTDSEFVEIDIERSDVRVAPVLRDARTGAVIVDADIFTNKKFKPPIMSLGFPVPLYDLMQRMPGEQDTAEVRGNWFGRLVQKIMKTIPKIHRMMKENLELQAAQVMQNGILKLKDDKGELAYELDYRMESSHKPTVSVSWGASGATPLADLEALCDAINDDGKAEPAIAIFGRNAWNHAIDDSKFKDAVKKEGMNLGQLSPGLKNRGGRYMGYIDIGTYRLELWCYNNSYKEFKGDDAVKFMDPDKVIITAAMEDLEFHTVYGGVPTLGMKEPFTGVVPSVVKYDNFMRINNRVWHDEREDTYIAESKCRPLCIPVSIDRFGCLTTKRG